MELRGMRETCFRSGHFVSANDLWTSGPSHPQPCRFERIQRVHLESLCQFLPERRAAAKWPLPVRRREGKWFLLHHHHHHHHSPTGSKNSARKIPNQIKPDHSTSPQPASAPRASQKPQTGASPSPKARSAASRSRISSAITYRRWPAAPRRAPRARALCPQTRTARTARPRSRSSGPNYGARRTRLWILRERLLAVGARRSRGLEAVAIMFAVGLCGMSGAGSERLLFK